jgi:hypothetical protein
MPLPPVHRDDVRIPDIVFCREASLLTTAVASEVDKVRLEIDQGLGDVAGTYRPLSIDQNVVSFPAPLDSLLDFAYLLVYPKLRRAHGIGSEKEDLYDRAGVLRGFGAWRRSAHTYSPGYGAVVTSIRPAVSEIKMDRHLRTCL